MAVAPIQGLYFWGGVGRGKTYLMDMFYECLPGERKLRLHFHRFMYRVHHEMQRLSQQKDPLDRVADIFKSEVDVICFDEFFVSDITDAMILATLLEALFKRGICLVATSNIPPGDLYRNGLQRARFLPAIALIEQHCQIVHLDAGIDYRLRTLEQAEIYHFPLDAHAERNLCRYFNELSVEPRQVDTSIVINQRDINVRHEADGIVHISFYELCQTARSQNDYIELARIYNTVLIADVWAMGDELDDAARRFIAMIDEFYERNVKVIISAEVAMEALYHGERLEFEFRRCLSRLREMQSHDYLAQPHLAG